MKRRRKASGENKRKVTKRGVPLFVLVGMIVAGLVASLAGVWVRERGHTNDVNEHQSIYHLAQHSGVVRMVGHRKFELVVTTDTVTFYVYQDANPALSAGGKVVLIYAFESQSESVELQPAGENKFQAQRPPQLRSGMNVIALVNIAGASPLQLKFGRIQ